MTNPVTSTRVPLNNGLSIPVIGLGTYEGSKSGRIGSAVKSAIDFGYRHFDSAFMYGSEKEIGEALKEKFSEGLKREELFITSKLWNTHHEPSEVRPALERTLKDLQLDYVDLYLIHWPFAFEPSDELFACDEKGNMLMSDRHYKDVWPEMEKLVDAGLAKSIGLSNFNSKQIDEICEISHVKPAVLQCESHPYLNQNKLIEHCKKYGIVFTAYSPLGAPGCYPPSKDVSLHENQILKDIANKYGKTTAQICLKYQIQRQVVVVPKSFDPNRIQLNASIFDFQLTDEEMKEVDSLDRNWRVCPFPLNFNALVGGEKIDPIKHYNHPLHPFRIPY